MFFNNRNQKGLSNATVLIYIIIILLLLSLGIFIWFIFDYVRRQIIYKRQLKSLEEIEKLGNGIGHNTLLKVLASQSERSKKSEKAVRFSKFCAQLDHKQQLSLGNKFDTSRSTSSSSSSGRALRLASSGLDPVLDVVKSLKSKAKPVKVVAAEATNKLQTKTELRKTNLDKNSKKNAINKPDKNGPAGVSNLESNDNLSSSKTYRSLLSTRSDPNFKENGFSIKLEGYVRDNELTKKLDKYLKDKKNIEDQLFKADLKDEADHYLDQDIRKKLDSVTQEHLKTIAGYNETSLISAIKPSIIEPKLETDRKQSEDTLFTLSTAYEPEPLQSKMIASMVSIRNNQVSSIEPTLSKFIAPELERSRIECKTIKLEPILKELDQVPAKTADPKIERMPKLEVDQVSESKKVKTVKAKLDKMPKLETDAIDKVTKLDKIHLKYKTGEIGRKPVHLTDGKETDLSRAVTQMMSKGLVEFIPKSDALKDKSSKEDINSKATKDVTTIIAGKGVKEMKIEGIKQDSIRQTPATIVLKGFYDSKNIKDPPVTIKKIKATKLGKDIKMTKKLKSFKVIKKFKVKPAFKESRSLDLHQSDSSSDEDSERVKSRRSTISKLSETDIRNKK